MKMDHWRYFNKPRLEMEPDQTNSELNEKNINNFEFDVGNFINHEKLSVKIIYKSLYKPWVPEYLYNFKKDSSDRNRSFHPK